jgi:P pilus assembly chaperone PapD
MRLPISCFLTGIALASLARPVSADMSIDVSPIRVQVRLQAGDEYTNSVRVLNSGLEPIRLRSYLQDWTLDEAGTPIFKQAGTEKRTASLWIEAAPSDFLLEPGETKYVRFTAKVPAGIPDGGYYGSLILESLPLDRAVQGSMHMFVQGRVATMVYLTVGSPKRSAQITSLMPVKKGDKRYVRLTVANTGDDVIRLAGDLAVLDKGNPKGAAVTLPDVPVLPGMRRIVDLDLESEFNAQASAHVRLDLDGIGQLLGQCPLDPDKVQLIP